MSTLAKPANGVSSPASVTKASTPKPDAAKQSNEANASSRPWWRDIKQPRVSMHTDPVWGLKVSKTLDVKGLPGDDKHATSVTVGALADYSSKTIHTFAKLEREVGEPGKIAVDVTGVELQKKFEFGDGVLATDVSIGVGVQWDGKPYVNFDAMPRSSTFKAVGAVVAINSGRSLDVRPSRPLFANVSVESPISLYRDGTELNLQSHGLIAAVTLPRSEFSVAKK